MPRYLIDVNVPRDPSIWPADNAVYAIDLKVGNMRLAEFRAFIKPRWPRIAALSEQAQLVQVYRDQIETLS